MEKILEAAAQQVPSLVVLVVVVIVFLRAGKQQGTEFQAMLVAQRTTFVEALKREGERSEEISEACHAVAREATAAVRENSRVLGSVETSLQHTGQIMADTTRELRRHPN